MLCHLDILRPNLVRVKKKESVAEGNLTKPIPLERPGYPEDIAPAVLYLASESASYITGELLYIDGGWQTF